MQKPGDPTASSGVPLAQDRVEARVQRFGHGGSNEGFVAQVCFYRDRGQGAVAMVNPNEGSPLLGEILRSVAREYAWPEYSPPDPAASPATGALDAHVGAYAAKSFECSVAQKATSCG